MARGLIEDVLTLFIIFINYFLGLFHRQKNQGTEEEQESVIFEPG